MVRALGGAAWGLEGLEGVRASRHGQGIGFGLQEQWTPAHPVLSGEWGDWIGVGGGHCEGTVGALVRALEEVRGCEAVGFGDPLDVGEGERGDEEVPQAWQPGDAD